MVEIGKKVSQSLLAPSKVAPTLGDRGTEHSVFLDGRPLVSPARSTLAFNSLTLTAGLASEWARQIKTVKVHSMPLTSLASGGADAIPGKRATVVGNMLAYLRCDTIRIRIPEGSGNSSDRPATEGVTSQEVAAALGVNVSGNGRNLAEEQRKHYDPLIAWFQRRFNARLPLLARDAALAAEPGSEELALEPAITALQWHLFGLPDAVLIGLMSLADATKSAVIPLAVYEGVISAEDACRLLYLEEESGGSHEEGLPTAEAEMYVTAASFWLACQKDDGSLRK
jgi:chaperone required for assembly of F1-ATPase